MFRYLALICLSAIVCTTATPYKSWGEEKQKAIQDTRSQDFKEKIMVRLKEAEPVEEVHTDPHLAIWKYMKQFHQQKYNKPEEDKGNLNLRFAGQPLNGNKQAEGHQEPQYNIQGQLYKEAEEDLDDVYHNTNGLVNHGVLKERLVQPEIPVPDKGEVVELRETNVYMTPEEDKDSLYHGDFTGQVFHAPLLEDPPKKVYTEPEEDRDHLFHS